MRALPYHAPLLRRLARALSPVIGAVLLAGCSVLETFNALVPTEQLVRKTAIAYGQPADDHPRRKLDIYVPTAPAPAGGRPVVVFFYGGSWDSGRREDYLFVAEALTSQGWIAVLPDYRLYPEVLFPDFLDDAALAMRWTRDNIAQHGGDTKRIFAMGHSAGAHIAAMLTYDAQHLARVGMRPTELAGFVGLAGPYDFLPLKSERLKIIFGPEAGRARSQPINFVTGDAPPALLLHGDADTIVGPHNSANLARRITERGGRVRHLTYPGLGHREIVVNLAALFRAGKPELPAIANFIHGTPPRTEVRTTTQARLTNE
ncbi:MAG: alpha/beta hydrolase [Betaproteobacteria bacterium]|nr:alpha/beta hydrolase [Betaproteobacteria bacterium]